MGVGKRVRGEGPIPCSYFVAGEYPGREEAKTGRPFAAKRGRENELDRYFNGVQLPGRHEIYLTTMIKEWCGDEGEFTADDWARDLPDFETEIRAVRPRVVVALGRAMTQFFLGDIDMESCHGIPWYMPPDSAARALFENPGDVVIFPLYNPSAGFRSPELSASVTYDFTQLEAFLNGTLAARILYDDPIPEPDYREITSLDELDAIMVAATLISTDSEGYAWAPWSVQITVEDGVAYVLRYKNSPLIERFAEWVDARVTEIRFIFHNALHDLGVFRAIGVDTTELVYEDTMIMAYNLQLEPQGLKPLCARWCNMKMMHFDECMGNASFELAQDWLLMVQENEDEAHAQRCAEEMVRLQTTPYVDARGNTRPGRKIKVAPKLPKSDLHKSIERCLRSRTPRKLWTDQVIDRHVAAHEPYGDMWVATLDHVPLSRAIGYAGRDSDGTHRLFPRLEERVRANELWDVYRADLGTVSLIDRMQRVGIKPDLGHFARLSGDLGVELSSVLSRVHGRIKEAPALGTGSQCAFGKGGTAFNPNSTDHTADLLFERFGVAALKRTSEGNASTNDKVLEALEKDTKLDPAVRDIIADIRQYREYFKLKNTFVDQIPEFTNRWPFDGRIHATFRITRVITGRLSASNPNLLALPKHGKFATRFREGFIADAGHSICSWDLSQIELRVLAHLSQDPVLLAAFRTGLDLHAKLAQRIFGGVEADHKKGTTRLAAKAVNFGIPMGMTNIGLCLELRKNGVDVNEDDAERWLRETMSLYAGVPVFQQTKISEARRFGFVADLRGRRRYIGGIRSFDEAVRAEAERFAFSTPIQAGAQEIMKEAEAYVYTHTLVPRWKRGEWVEPLVQIHDDLVMEMSDHLVHEIDREMVYAMTQVPAHWLSVPIETSGDYGSNWGNQKPIREEVAA